MRALGVNQRELGDDGRVQALRSADGQEQDARARVLFDVGWRQVAVHEAVDAVLQVALLQWVIEDAAKEGWSEEGRSEEGLREEGRVSMGTMEVCGQIEGP